MKIARRSVILLIVLGLGVSAARAQQNSPCPGEVDDAPPPGSTACTNANTMLGIGAFSADPLIDGTGESYMDPDNNIVSLYGVYGLSLIHI